MPEMEWASWRLLVSLQEWAEEVEWPETGWWPGGLCCLAQARGSAQIVFVLGVCETNSYFPKFLGII